MTKLERYLSREVLGRNPKIERKPPKRETGRAPARDPKYLAWIRTQPSAVSGQYGCEAAHSGSDHGMGQKASDYSAIPLTPAEHREYHRIGKPAFERKHRLDCARLARKLLRAWIAGGRRAA